MIENNPLQFTSQISFELSNLCNLTSIHQRCPLNFSSILAKGKVILPSWVIYKTVDELAKYEYKETVSFNIYNEPTNDPRLFMFIKYVKENSNARTFIITNGTYLNQQMVDELYEAGLDILWISSYSGALEREFNSFAYPEGLQYQVLENAPLQIISDTYDRDYLDWTLPCHSPLGQINIRSNGNVVLCCRDYESRHKFGNLHDESLIDVIQKSPMQNIYDHLIKGDRSILDICRRCNTSF